jgi:hypothetical protein
MVAFSGNHFKSQVFDSEQRKRAQQDGIQRRDEQRRKY